MRGHGGLIGGAWILSVAACNFGGSGPGVADTGTTGTTGSGQASNTTRPGAPTGGDPDGTTDDGSMDSGGSADTSTDSGRPDTWPEGYGFRKEISIQPASNLEGFPVGILFDRDPDLVVNAAADGVDLFVTAEDGLSPLPFEVESYADGSAVVWINAGPLGPDQATIVYLYYGNRAPPAAPAVSATWPERFDAVWHMGVTDLVLIDSSEPGYDSVADNIGAGVTAEGIAGASTLFEKVGSQTVPDNGRDGLDFDIQDSMTMSMWVFVADSMGEFDSPLHKGAAGSGTEGYGVFLGQDAWTAWVADLDETILGGAFGMEVDFVDTWTHLVLTVDREAAEVRLYTNGQLVVTADATVLGSLQTAQDLSLSWGVNPFRGSLDEVRIERASVDLERVQAAYNNLADPSQLYTVGAQETP